MKSWLAAAGVFAAVLAAGSALAEQPPAGPRRDRAGPPPHARPMPVAPHRDAEGYERPQRGRLTPEERRQLRRDIHQYGRDVYRDRREASSQD